MNFLIKQSRCGIIAVLQSVLLIKAEDTLYLGGPQKRTENER
jgi:hypothetical protein